MNTNPAAPLVSVICEIFNRILIPIAPLRAILLTALLAVSTASAYTLEAFAFEDPAQAAAFRELIEELRCLVCQNESLAGSQAELAQDLREEVYRRFRAGEGRDEIVDFLVARYGDFVLYDPPLKPSTYLLWFGPFLLITVSTFFLIRTLLHKRQSPDSALSPREHEQLRELLDPHGSDRDGRNGPDQDKSDRER